MVGLELDPGTRREEPFELPIEQFGCSMIPGGNSSSPGNPVYPGTRMKMPFLAIFIKHLEEKLVSYRQISSKRPFSKAGLILTKK